MRSPLRALDDAVVPALARGLRRAVDRVRFAPTDVGAEARRLDDRHSRRGVLGFVRDLPQTGFLAIGVLLVVGSLAAVRIDSEGSGASGGGTPGAATAVAKGCPVGAVPAGQGAVSLGPTDGTVAAYQQKVMADLAACAKASPGATFYALVSFDGGKSPTGAAGALEDVTALQVYVDLPTSPDSPRVLPVTDQGTGQVKVTAAITAAYAAAAAQFEQDGQLQTAQANSINPVNATEQQGKTAFEQAAATDAAEAHALRSSCGCTYGALVVGRLSQLVTLQTSSVRAIELAPAGAQPAGINGRPLLPSETDTLSTTAAAPSAVVAGSL